MVYSFCFLFFLRKTTPQNPTNCATSNQPRERSSRQWTRCIKMSQVSKSARKNVSMLPTGVSHLTLEILPTLSAEPLTWIRLLFLTSKNRTWRFPEQSPTNSMPVITVRLTIKSHLQNKNSLKAVSLSFYCYVSFCSLCSSKVGCIWFFEQQWLKQQHLLSLEKFPLTLMK